MPRATLYSIPGSHSAMTVQRMLDLKGIPYRRIDLLPIVSRLVTKLMRFPEVTIPALRIDGQRISGSLEISRALERIRPEPPLFPAETTARVAVEDAEHWGNQVLQDAVRRILWNAIRRDHKPLGTYAEGAKIGIPIALAVKTAAPIIAAEVRINGAENPAVQADLAAFPAWLRRVDDWIEQGTLGADPPNAADLQIAAGLRLAMTLEDLRPFIEGRPCGELAMRIVPQFPGRTPAILPDAWLEPLRADQSA